MNEIESLKKQLDDLQREVDRLKKRSLIHWMQALSTRGWLIFLAGAAVSFGVVYATQLTVPTALTDGSILSASDLNTRFNALYNESNAQDTRLTTIEGKALWLKNGTAAYYSAGNVGVKTNNPLQDFHVNGDARFTSSVPKVEFDETDTTNQNYRIILNGGDLRFQSCDDSYGTCTNQVVFNNTGVATFSGGVSGITATVTLGAEVSKNCDPNDTAGASPCRCGAGEVLTGISVDDVNGDGVNSNHVGANPAIYCKPITVSVQ